MIVIINAAIIASVRIISAIVFFYYSYSYFLLQLP